MSTLIIKAGNFYRDGVMEPPEIGNIDQIECLKRYNNFKDVKLRICYEEHWASVAFKCACGNLLFKDISFFDAGSDDIDENCFDGKTVRCKKCLQDYELIEIEPNELIARIS